MGTPTGETRADWAATETPEERRKRARLILRRLTKLIPSPETALTFSSPFELLVATVLSAQSTDKMVNKITVDLFRKYRAPADYLAAAPGELEDDIRQSGFFNQKARSIRGLCQTLIDEFGGEVPRTMDELIRLPGVARKTANVVLSNAFGVHEGIAVDTHVQRLTWRLWLSEHTDPVKIERDLMALYPRARWNDVSHLLILHGRDLCSARAPRCTECPLSELCPATRAPQRAGRARRKS